MIRCVTPLCVLACALTCALLTACADAEHPASAPSVPSVPRVPSVPIKQPTEPDDVMGRHLREKASEHTAGLVPAGMFFRDHIGAGEQRDFLAVLRAEHCYRFVGVGDPAVDQLDLILYNQEGVQVQEDLGQDAYPVLGVDAEMCPPQPGAYRLRVRMTAGKGEFLVGVYRTPQ